MKTLLTLIALLLILSSCGRYIGPSKTTKVRCPTYPNYYHNVKKEHMRTMNPDLCPAYQDPRKSGFGRMGN